MDGKTFIAIIFLLILLIFIFDMQQVASKLTQVVQTDKGPVQGIVLSTVLNHIKYSVFKGIPYAKPPIGSLRFKPPVEIEPWQNVRNSEKEGEICIQTINYSDHITGSENCLFLNIYTPMINFQNKNEELKAVIVWIHSGSFLTGSGNQKLYGPDFLIEEGVIVVTFNYRLAAFGFLSLNHSDALGNTGLKDQNLVLRWIQRNIRNFGGDPNKVTLAGQSAGAASVDYHILSDLSKGLFQRSISMSGSATCPWGFITPGNAIINAYSLGLLINNGQNITNSDELLEILRNATAADITLKTAQLPLFLPFIPTLENSNIAYDEKKCLTKYYMEQYQTGNYNQQPRMMGFTSLEALIFTDNKNELLSLKNLILPYFSKCQSLSSVISKSFDEQFSSNYSMSSLERLFQLLSDVLFIAGIDLQQQLISNTSNEPIYYYRNSFDAKNESFHQIIMNRTILNGTGHLDDVYYIFYSDYMKNFSMNPNSPLSITRNKMVRMWTNFAKYGNPTPEGTNDKLLNITWLDSRSTGTHLEISDELIMKNTRPISESIVIYQRNFLVETTMLSVPKVLDNYDTFYSSMYIEFILLYIILCY